jgi:molybdopterin/thiamine biosynthesis adenylyltransferase
LGLQEEAFLYQNPTDQSAPTTSEKPARILVVGVGALGCPAARLLATHTSGSNGGNEAGTIGLLTLIDPDRVELSNLQRQPLFDDADIGSYKAQVAGRKLANQSNTRIDTLCTALDDENAEALIAAHDYVIDATDSPKTKYLINDTACRLGVAFSYGGVVRTGGQAMAVVPGHTACLRCVFPDAGADDQAGACSEMGILAPIAGLIGSLQAAQALGHISHRPFEGGAMTIYNLRGERIKRVAFHRRNDCAGCSPGGETLIAKPPQNSQSSSSTQSGTAALADSVDVASADLRRQTTCHS